MSDFNPRSSYGYGDPNRGPVRVMPNVLQFNQYVDVKPGDMVKIAANPMIDFLPLWLVIPKQIGQYIDVIDIQQGNQLMLIGNGGVIDGLAFRETLSEKIRIKLPWRRMRFGERISLGVMNVSLKPVTVKAHILGVAVEPELLSNNR